MLDKKRVITISIIILILVFGIFFIYNIFIKDREIPITEIIPEQEISEDQFRNTMITLYFKCGDKISSETKLIDVKELIDNPYEILLNMLIDGPKNDNLEKTIPEGTKINKIIKNDDILIIDFSNEFIENHCCGEIEEKLTINSIVYTLTELKEINGIKILINGEENKMFKDNYINFNNIFKREN